MLAELISQVPDVDTTTKSSNRPLGFSIFVIQSLVYAAFILCNERVASRMQPMTLTFYMLLFGALSTLSFGIPFAVMPPGLSNLDIRGYLALLWIGIFASVVAQSAFSYASTHLPPTIMSMSILLSPVCSSALGALLLGERLTKADFFGGALILIGLVIVITARSRERSIAGFKPLTSPAVDLPIAASPLDAALPVEGHKIVRKHHSDQVELQQLVQHSPSDEMSQLNVATLEDVDDEPTSSSAFTPHSALSNETP